MRPESQQRQPLMAARERKRRQSPLPGGLPAEGALRSPRAAREAGDGTEASTETLETLRKRRLSLAIDDETLADVVAFFGRATGLVFHLSDGIAADEVMIDLQLRDVTLESALSLMLRPRGLDYRIRNGVIEISPGS